MEIRLQKYIADCGISSRRQAEKLIEEGEISVNGKIVTQLGTKIDPKTDKVVYQDKIVKNDETLIYYAINKPTGYVTTVVHNQDDKIVSDLLPPTPRVFPIGRLDKDSSGLIILTNDGELTYQLTHPKFEHAKEYIVEMMPNSQTHFTKNNIEKNLNKLSRGVMLDGKHTSPAVVNLLDIDSKQNIVKFSITIHEGRNRQIRRMVERVSFHVVGLHRVRIENLKLDDLKSGEFKVISRTEII